MRVHDMSRVRAFDVLRSLAALTDANNIIVCGRTPWRTSHAIAFRSLNRTTVNMYVYMHMHIDNVACMHI